MLRELSLHAMKYLDSVSGSRIQKYQRYMPLLRAYEKKSNSLTLRQCLFFIQRKDLYLRYFYKFSQAIQNRIFQTCLIASSSISATLCTILLILKSWLAGRGGCRSVCSVRRPAVREGRRTGIFYRAHRIRSALQEPCKFLGIF